MRFLRSVRLALEPLGLGFERFPTIRIFTTSCQPVPCAPKDRRWMPSRNSFFLPVKALSPIFRRHFKAEIEHAGLFDQISSNVWDQKWVVHCQATGG